MLSILMIAYGLLLIIIIIRLIKVEEPDREVHDHELCMDYNYSFSYTRSIWAAEGGEGACNLRAIKIQIQTRNWAWLSVYVYGNSHFQ